MAFADSKLVVHVSKTSVQKTQIHTFAISLSSHAHAALAPAKSTSRFSDTLRSAAIRQKTLDYTNESTLTVHVSAADSKKVEVQLFVKK